MAFQLNLLFIQVAAAAALIALVPAVAVGQSGETSSGSGVVIGAHGEVLTNAHVVPNCAQITVRPSSGEMATATLVARDEKNDLAVIRTRPSVTSIATFRDGAPVRAGDGIVALGYPLSGLLATTVNLTVGNVSALAGLGDDSRYLQISAPVQPGNSGGPLLDTSGHLVGIVSSKLNAALIARSTGDIPQNVNFAIKAEVARTFLDSHSIPYQTARSEHALSPADVGDAARPFTVEINCSGSQALADDRTVTPGKERAVFYEQDANNPSSGRRYSGFATWRIEMVSSGPGHLPEPAVRAEIKIPERGMTIIWELRRNTDRALPATHTVQVIFKLPPDFPGGAILNVPGVLMKQTEQARGTPLAGLAVKVNKDFFLVGLSAVAPDARRNTELLRDREWFDIPIVYGNGDHAILAMEKGPSGDRLFAEAFGSWSQ